MNKLYSALFVLILIYAGQFRVVAQSTSAGYYSEFGQPAVWVSGGTPVPDNNQVCIGYFDAGFDVMANAGDLDELALHWHQFDSTTINLAAGAGEGGHFADEQTLNGASAPLFANQQIWLWVFKTSDNSAPDAGYGDVSEYGLYSSTASNWRFKPVGSPPANRTDIYTTDPSIYAAWGSLSGGHLNLSPVAPIPEPAVGALLAMGLGYLGLAFRSRKK